MSDLEDILGIIKNTNTTPTIPLTDLQQIRFSEMAKELEIARTQGYVEANVMVKLLELAKEIVPLLKGI